MIREASATKAFPDSRRNFQVVVVSIVVFVSVVFVIELEQHQSASVIRIGERRSYPFFSLF